MTATVAISAYPRLNRLQQAAAPLLFILLGVIYASWASRIPAIRDGLQLSPAQLGLVLLGGGCGAVGSFPLAAWLVAHYGGRRAAWYAGLGLLAALPCLAFAPNMPLLIVAMVAMGAASGCFDVAINAIGAETERLAERSIMSLLHAWFCLGALLGALLGSAMAGMAVTPMVHFSAASLALGALLLVAYGALPRDQPLPDTARKYFALAHGPLVALGVIGFCGAVAEGSIADWSGVFMTDQLGAAAGVAPLAYAAFAAMMLLARLVCDRLKDRFGARRVVAGGALIAALGVFVAVLALNVPVTIAGFALAGVGLAAVFPFVFSAAGRHGSTALAAVATLSYSGGLIGPPILGFLAQGWGMRAALAFIGVLGIAIAVSASRAKWLE